MKRRRKLARKLLKAFGHVCTLAHPRNKVCQALKVAERLFRLFDVDIPDQEAPKAVDPGVPAEREKPGNKRSERRSLERAIRIVATGAGAGALMRGLLGIESKRAAVRQAQGIVRFAPGTPARTRGRGGFQFQADKFLGQRRKRIMFNRPPDQGPAKP